jgi:FAD/FMN-containing dehydrogenase
MSEEEHKGQPDSDGTVAVPEVSALQALQASLRGELLRPGDAAYDDARRIWNGAIQTCPRLIARCTGAADVIAAVRFARQRGLLVSVKAGGHGVSGTALCDELVIDVSGMRGVRVDPGRRRAVAQAGVLWSELDHETQIFGLATTGGIVTHTGIAGLTLGGGIGWLMRKHGLTADNLVGADVITADGELVHASDKEHPDLLWGLRGGGGNFGIVTSLEYALHPVGPMLLCGPILWPMEDASDVLRHYRDFVATAPDELATIVTLRKAPPLPAIPAQLHGRPVCMIATCYAGLPGQGERVLEGLRHFGRPLVDLVTVKPYVAHQSMFDLGVPHGWHYYWKSAELPELQDDVIDILVEHAARISSPRSYAVMFHLGGAVARVPEDATAYSHRDAIHNININAVWQPHEAIGEQERAWTHRFFSALEPHQVGVYVNFLGDEGEARVRAAYGPDKYERLVALKDRYDPDNFFRINQNIRPSRLSAHSR